MPERRRHLDGPDCGEDLRRILAVRRRRRRRLAIATLAGMSALPLAATVAWPVPRLLVWNASASAPLGLYAVRPHVPIRRGDMVIAWTPEPARSLAAVRHYLPQNVPVVKRSVAVAGDRVCAAGRTVSINGKVAAIRRNADAAGRPLPSWAGCRRLVDGEHLLLMDHPASFDGRYFGVTQATDILGAARLVWESPTVGSGDER